MKKNKKIIEILNCDASLGLLLGFILSIFRFTSFIDQKASS